MFQSCLYMFLFVHVSVCTCSSVYMFEFVHVSFLTPCFRVSLSILGLSDTLKNFLKMDYKNILSVAFSEFLIRIMLNFMKINNLCEILIKQPQNSLNLNILKMDHKNDSHQLDQWISHDVHYGLNLSTINNLLEILVEQLWISDILHHRMTLHDST